PRTGIKISANILITPKRWKKDKYETQHLFNASYGFVRGGVNVGYVGLFPKAIGSFDFIIKARADVPAIESFYGIGNETIEDVKSSSYYRTYSHRYFAAMGFQKVTEHHNVELNGIYQAVRVDRKEGKYLSGLNPNLTEYNTNHFAGGEIAYRYRAVNDKVFPTKGFRFSIGGLYLNNIKKQNTSFTNFKSDVTFYLPLGKNFSIASRAAVAILSGEANFYHLNKLKGNLDLRGYNRERFYGKSAFNNNNELRWAANTRNFLFTGKIGLLGFYDIGRVWQPLEQSNTWHTGYGGGFFIIPFNKIFLVATYEIPNGNDESLLQLRTGIYF
ncbi:MAG: BamA/TamA family outer membrane protein, partial [Chitinophagaceae bacterium]